MKCRSLLFALMVLAVAACQKSEITDKPAAAVAEASTTTIDPATTAQPAGPLTRANVIKEKSRIDWVGAKVTRDHDGSFKNFDGTIEYAGATPQRVSFEIDLASIESDEPDLTKHLKTPDFFDVAKFPRATFTSTALTPADAAAPAGTTHMLRGTLDLHGVQKDVVIPVKAEQTAEGVRTTSEFTINRHDWGISYRGMADDLIRDDVLIKLDLMFPPPAAA